MLMCQILSGSVYSITFWQQTTPNFAIFLDGHILWCCQLAAYGESSTWVHNYKSFCIKIVSILWWFHGKIIHTNSVVQKRDGNTKKWTDWKLNVFGHLVVGRRVKSEPHQTCHGNRGPWTHSCISKTFGGLMYSFATRGAENLGKPATLRLKPP